MIAIILAAGSGRRLFPLTEQYPKPLVPLPNESTPIDLLVAGLRDIEISDILVVRSDDRVAPPGCRLIDADGSGNMVHTLMSAYDDAKQLGQDILITYADILLELRLLRAAAHHVGRRTDISVLADTRWEQYYRWRFDAGVGDAESFTVGGGLITEIGQPLNSRPTPIAQYIGVLRLTQRGLDCIREQYKLLNDIGVFMTSVLQELIDRGAPIEPIFVEGGWLELDSYSDYLKASAVMAGAESVTFFDPRLVSRCR